MSLRLHLCVLQEEWSGGVGSLQDGRVPLCVYSDCLRYEAAALDTGCGTDLRQGSPVHHQAQ